MLFQEIEKAIPENGCLTLVVRRNENSLSIIVSASHGIKDTQGNDNKIPPLLIKGSAEEIDQQFAEQLASFKKGVDEFTSSLEEMQAQIKARQEEMKSKAKSYSVKKTDDKKKRLEDGASSKHEKILLTQPAGSSEFHNTLTSCSLATLKSAYEKCGDTKSKEKIAEEIKKLAGKTPEDLGLKAAPQMSMFGGTPPAAKEEKPVCEANS